MSDEKLHGTTECPICQSGSPHNHRATEIALYDRLIAAEKQLDIERTAFMDDSALSAKALGEARTRIKWLGGRLAEIANDRFMADLEAQVFAWVRDAVERQNIARAALAEPPPHDMSEAAIEARSCWQVVVPPPCQHRWFRKEEEDLCIDCGARTNAGGEPAEPRRTGRGDDQSASAPLSAG